MFYLRFEMLLTNTFESKVRIIIYQSFVLDIEFKF